MTERLHPSTISKNRTEVLHIGQQLARIFESALHGAGYKGPVAVAGGYLRDIGLMREPKDLDIFIDGGHCTSMDEAKRLGEALCQKLKCDSYVMKVMPCYGTWAEDVAMVSVVALTGASPFGWPIDAPIPEAIDIVVLLRPELVKAGYNSQMTNNRWNQEMFLHAVLARVDLRLNAIGATPQVTEASPYWDFDAYYSRLVVQHARKDGTDRIAKRLTRLLEGKYSGWTIGYEDDKGEVSSRTFQAAIPTITTPAEQFIADAEF